jgi:hypothetical protein
MPILQMRKTEVLRDPLTCAQPNIKSKLSSPPPCHQHRGSNIAFLCDSSSVFPVFS